MMRLNTGLLRLGRCQLDASLGWISSTFDYSTVYLIHNSLFLLTHQNLNSQWQIKIPEKVIFRVHVQTFFLVKNWKIPKNYFWFYNLIYGCLDLLLKLTYNNFYYFDYWLSRCYVEHPKTHTVLYIPEVGSAIFCGGALTLECYLYFNVR